MHRERIKKNVKNFFFLLISNIGGKLLYFYFVTYIVKELGPTESGVLFTAQTFTSMFTFLFSLGLDMLIIREIAKDKSKAGLYTGNALLLKIFSSIFSILFILISASVLSYQKDIFQLILILTFGMTIINFTSTFEQVIRAYEKTDYLAVISFFGMVFRVTTLVTAIHVGLGVVHCAIIIVIYDIIIGLASVVYTYRNNLINSLQIRKNELTPIIQQALPFTLATIFATVYYRIDTVMISLIQSTDEVTRYHASYRILEGLLIIPNILGSVLFPVLSSFYYNKKILIDINQNILKFVFTVSFLLSSVLIVNANSIYILLFSNRLSDSVLIFQILLSSLPVTAFCCASATLFSATGRQHINLIITIVVLVTNFLLNLIIIPRYGALGAAATTLTSELIGIVFHLIFNRDYINLIFFIKESLRPIAASAIMVISLNWINASSLLLNIFVGVLIFLIGLFFAGGIKRSDFILVRSLMDQKI
ncbi:flippase [uncultured Desulfosarcina sp.]|uniref:flippase n=1 Tax=uncultured Desulfosarcina sp. TaxID=218289 RepID=UPI0029C74EF8|nr:flippase [uncultured Desulfosarcina sp.]